MTVPPSRLNTMDKILEGCGQVTVEKRISRDWDGLTYSEGVELQIFRKRKPRGFLELLADPRNLGKRGNAERSIENIGVTEDS